VNISVGAVRLIRARSNTRYRRHSRPLDKTTAQLSHCRWQVELYFEWFKKCLLIKAFFEDSENAVRRQIWGIISVYVLVACVKKRLDIIVSLYTILQLLGLSVLRRISLIQPLTDAKNAHGGSALSNRIEFTQANIGTLNGFENKSLVLPRGRQLRDIPRTEVGVGNQ